MLDAVRVRRSMVGQSRVRAPWALAVESTDPIRLVAMVEGTGWLRHGDREPVPLPQGAVAVVTDVCTFEVADHPATAPTLAIAHADWCYDPRTGESRVDHERLTTRAWGAPDADASVLVGSYEATGQRFSALAATLPDVIVVTNDPMARSTLAAAAAETLDEAPGQQVVLDRLMELLLFATVRASLAAEPRPPGWYRAWTDPLVGPALRAIHDRPAHDWTVAALAEVTAQSRSAFARRFRHVVGEPPMTYLTRWRLACGADLLADGTTVESAARAVGYTDPFAFSTAFRRHHGHTPSQHRRRRGTG